MRDKYLLGIDLGTSSLKSIIVDQEGYLLACSGQAYAIDTPHPGWAEQNPEVWVSAMVQTVRRAVSEAQIEPEQIAAIGLSGQMHGPVCLDGLGGVLCLTILWADQRSTEQIRATEQEIGQEQLAFWNGNPLDTGFILASRLWFREHETEVVGHTAQSLLPDDYLRYRMTGVLGVVQSEPQYVAVYTCTCKSYQRLYSAIQSVQNVH